MFCAFQCVSLKNRSGSAILTVFLLMTLILSLLLELSHPLMDQLYVFRQWQTRNALIETLNHQMLAWHLSLIRQSNLSRGLIKKRFIDSSQFNAMEAIELIARDACGNYLYQLKVSAEHGALILQLNEIDLVGKADEIMKKQSGVLKQPNLSQRDDALIMTSIPCHPIQPGEIYRLAWWLTSKTA